MDRHSNGKTVKGLAGAAVLGLCLAGQGCTPDFVTNNQADVLLTITSIVGVAHSGPNSGVDSAFLDSDVASDEGGVISDDAKVTVRSDVKNQVGVDDPGAFNDILLERYDVEWTRTDGHNVQGIDVPYNFSGPLAIRVAPGGETDAVFVVVRHEAKLESPLRNMRAGGGLDILHTIANITLHGRTTSGKVVQVQGRLEVTFADFADEAN